MNCIDCDIELTDDNWTISARKKNYYICRKCGANRAKKYRNEKPWITKILHIRRHEHTRRYGWHIPNAIAYCLITSPCAYCGEIPIELNGLDRVDSTKGYTIGNIVPCCKHCNWAKSNFTVDEFKVHINKIHHYLIEK